VAVRVKTRRPATAIGLPLWTRFLATPSRGSHTLSIDKPTAVEPSTSRQIRAARTPSADRWRIRGRRPHPTHSLPARRGPRSLRKKRRQSEDNDDAGKASAAPYLVRSGVLPPRYGVASHVAPRGPTPHLASDPIRDRQAGLMSQDATGGHSSSGTIMGRLARDDRASRQRRGGG